MKNGKVNYGELTDLIADGVEAIYRDAIQKHPDETFYALTLTTYSDPSGIGVGMNSVENHKRILDAAGLGGDLKNTEQHNERAYYKWGWMEWGDYEFIGNHTPLDAVDKWLEAAYNSFSYEQDGEDWFDDYAANIHEAMIGALRQLDDKGVFGMGAARDKMFIYCGIYDDEIDLILRSAKALNSEQNWIANSPSLIAGLSP